MAKNVHVGDCVRVPDGRVGRVRQKIAHKYRVRLRRTTSATHQFLMFAVKDLERVDCPKGWMSPTGYTQYLKKTLAKMRDRRSAARKTR
jgi:hypothetical protein